MNMKSSHLLTMTLLCLSLATPAMAQLDELDHNLITIGSEAESITPDTQWYLVYNSRNGGGYWWDQGFSNEDEGYGVVYMSNGTDEVVYDGMTATAAAEFMVRFLSTDEDDKYYVQFGTGNYIWTPATWNGGSNDVLESVPTIEEASTLYGYLINDTPGHFGFYTTDGNLWRVDNNGQGATVVIWSSGTIESTGGNNDFAIYPVDLTYASDWEMAYMDCMTIYQQYIGYSGAFTTGTGPGCYGEAEVAAFEAALAAIAALDSPDANIEDMSAEEFNELGQAVLDAYEAVIASHISKKTEVAEGYYFFNCGLVFTETETTEDEEDPATGEIIPGETITTEVTKGMYSEINADGNIYALWKTAERSCPFLWKITDEGDMTYKVVNMATDATFDEVVTSTNLTMTVDGENLMSFDVGTGDEGTLFIRVSTQPEDDMFYLHCLGHSNGAGVSGNIGGWSNAATASQWLLEPVSEEEALALIAEFAPEKAQQELYVNAQAMIADAEPKMAIAKDMKGLITSVDQLSSPYTEESEGSLDALIDGDTSTYWHSDWSNGSVDPGTHYLQVELAEAYEDEELVFVFTRRNVNNDHIIQWGVYGAPTADADKDDCTFLAEIYTPFGSSTETLTSDAFGTEGFTTLRFYIDDTYVTSGTNDGNTRGYGHMSEFQLYTTTVNPTSQMVAMGDVYTNLENAIAAAKAEDEDITEATYNTLKAAYDAFIAVYVDPTELRNTLSEASTAATGMVIGTNPGEWSDTSSASALNTTITEATAYDAAGVYTQTQSDTYVETLTEQMAAIMETANKVETGKWYEIRFATEDEIEANGWSLSGGAATDTQPELYGKYMTVGELVYDDVSGSYFVEALSQSDIDDVCVGHSVYFQDKWMDILYEDYAKFRFISVGDTAYIMQNKATGLFLKAAGTSGGVTLSIHPSLFNVSAVGFGENIISAQTLNGDTQNNLHAQRDYNQLVTWDSAEAGTNSGLYIEDIDEAVADSYDGTECYMSLQYGVINMMCYPVEVTTAEGTIYGAYVDDTTITLAPMEDNVAPAGVPFIFINGDAKSLDGYDEDDEEEPVAFTHGYDLVKDAQTSGKLIGSYYGDEIGAGKLIADANELVVSKSSSTVAANGAYINGEYNSDDTIVIEFSDDTFDSIEQAIATVAQDGNIYTVDGKLMGKGNLSTVKTLGKGVYIVNGVKVLVK